MSKHTPGPWAVNKADLLDVYAPNNNAHTVATVAVTAGDEDEANAKLIAAAPEMAEALRNFIGFAGYHELEKHDLRLQLQLQEMRRALAKAGL